MTPHRPELCTLAILHPTDGLLLTERSDQRLPQVPVSRYARFAEEVSNAILRERGIDATVLFRPQLEGTSESWAVLTALNCDFGPGTSLEWSNFDAIADPYIKTALAQLNEYETGARPGPFARRRWFNELQDWVATKAHQLGLRPSGKVTQYNGSPTFSLVKFETETTPLWFKATGDPNRHEFAIAQEISRRAPEFIAPAVAFHKDWNGWLMLQADGEPIDVFGRQSGWNCAANGLAQVQTRFVGESSLLRRIGCRDRSMEWLSSRIDSLMDRAEEWMSRQPAGTASQPLSAAALRELKRRTHQLVGKLQSLQIGETLTHGDINPGNVLVSEERCWFLDWAESWISHPFISFEYLRELRKTHPDPTHSEQPTWLQQMRSMYALPWRKFYDNASIEKAFALSPTAAALVYAVVCAEAPIAAATESGRREAFLRSLIRRLDRETRLIETGVAA